MQLICASLGTILCYARPYSPESKGKIERWFKTLHDQWMNVIDWSCFTSLSGLNESLSQHIEKYNNTFHTAINEKPIDKFVKHINRIRFIPSKQELDYMFLYRVTRRVKNDSSISINNTLFEVPVKYVGDKINVRYDPNSLEKAYIFSDEGKVLETIYPINKIDNSKIIRNQNVKTVDFTPYSIN